MRRNLTYCHAATAIWGAATVRSVASRPSPYGCWSPCGRGRWSRWRRTRTARSGAGCAARTSPSRAWVRRRRLAIARR